MGGRKVRMVENKTRIIKRFIWLKCLEGKWKFLSNAHILQRCKERYSPGLELSGLVWVDWGWTDAPAFELFCRCGNELTSSGSFISDTDEGVRYECTDCFYKSLWNLDLGPFAVEITDGECLGECVEA